MEPDRQTIATRAAEVMEEIAKAAGRSGRSPGEITLVAVSKTFGAEVVRAGHAAGLRDFGENRVQELRQKAAELADLELTWHLIGHLQTNKVRSALPHIGFLHSLDRLSLALEIAKRIEPGRVLPVLLQVNTTGEESKSGAAPGEVSGLLAEVRQLDALRILGLMTIGPLEGGEKENRASFARLRELRDHLRAEHDLPLPHLSMGMSGDFSEAIEEGATIVRVGSRIFGPRG